MGRGATYKAVRRMTKDIDILMDGTVQVGGRPTTPFRELIERGADMRPVWDALKGTLLDPRSYAKPLVIQEGWPWIIGDPGYLTKGRHWPGRRGPHIAVGRTKFRLTLKTSRPCLPRLKRGWIRALHAVTEGYLASGEIMPVGEFMGRVARSRE